MKGRIIRLALALVVGALAYDVMPEGPALRQISAFLLAGASYGLFFWDVE